MSKNRTETEGKKIGTKKTQPKPKNSNGSVSFLDSIPTKKPYKNKHNFPKNWTDYNYIIIIIIIIII